MAPTSDERRAVAKALLGDPMITNVPKTRDGFEGMTYHEAAWRFWDMCRRVRSVANFDIANSTTSVLADLIDPTCHVVIPNEMDGECFCSECGALLGEYGYTAYCPCCGARVTSGGDV